MSETVADRQIGFKVYGPASMDGADVAADVYARKLAAFIAALKAADKATSDGKGRYRYRIARLHTSIPTAIIREEGIAPLGEFDASGIESFLQCADLLKRGDPEALRYGDCAKYLGALSRTNPEFGYAEAWDSKNRVVRADKFLRDQAKRVLSPASRRPESAGWFKGATYGTFDGLLQVIDNRGRLPLLKIALSAGGREIDCLGSSDELDRVASYIGKRVRVFGQAMYDGSDGLPVRIEAIRFEPVKAESDFSRWKGAFEHFDAGAWGVDYE
ncbi:MAG: hypothetical protein ABL308_12165 [Oceanicaulis sp.]